MTEKAEIVKKTKKKAEFGDFQTPKSLATDLCSLLSQLIEKPASIVEPTCGVGGILFAAADTFPSAEQIVGVEISTPYFDDLGKNIEQRPDNKRFFIQNKSYFDVNWSSIIGKLPSPLLVVGNPPWVTNSHLSVLESKNLPVKTNFQAHVGLDAMTGKSNFDISEWMLIDMLGWFKEKIGTLAMLVKTSVARKALYYAWKNNIKLNSAAIYGINSMQHFDAAVEACLLVCNFSPAKPDSLDCRVYQSIESKTPSSIIGYHDNQIVANSIAYEKRKSLQGQEWYKWRSGIKHDCSKVMELRITQSKYQNGYDEVVELEEEYLFPMLKTSDIANGNVAAPKRVMVVPQRTTGEETSPIEAKAPFTWQYLNKYSSALDGRKSSIYKKRPRFSVFGIGNYSFALWKVAISGFYKKIRFQVVGPVNGRPVVLDDSSYFLSCNSEEEAKLLVKMLNSDIAMEFFSAFVFLDSKRPVTVDLLKKLDLNLLAGELGCQVEFNTFLENKSNNLDALSESLGNIKKKASRSEIADEQAGWPKRRVGRPKKVNIGMSDMFPSDIA